MAKPEIMPRSAFAEAVGVSRTMVTRWVKAGLPLLPDGRIDAAVGRAWIAANIERRTDQVDVERFADAKARKESALASLRELELQQKRGELLPAGEVREAASGMVIRTREKFLGLPSELCDKLAGLADPVKVMLLLEKEIRRILQALADEAERDLGASVEAESK